MAGQQGAYVARLLNRKYLLDREIPTLPDSYKDSPYLKLRTGGSLLAKPFSFFNLGSLAYIGGAKAIAEVRYYCYTSTMSASTILFYTIYCCAIRTHTDLIIT